MPLPEDYIWAYGISALVGFFNGPGVPILWAMYADTADYAEWKFGRRATGIVFSAATFGQKFGWGIGGALTGWLLAIFNYVPNTVQTDRFHLRNKTNAEYYSRYINDTFCNTSILL